jgi:hypothetical protein
MLKNRHKQKHPANPPTVDPVPFIARFLTALMYAVPKTPTFSAKNVELSQVYPLSLYVARLSFLLAFLSCVIFALFLVLVCN